MRQNAQFKFVKIPFTKLLKVELSRFAMRMIEIVDNHNPEELHIKELFDALVAETPRINNLKDKHGAHPLTKEIRELRKTRALYISAIKLRLKVVTREADSDMAKHLKIVKYEIDHFLDSLNLSRNEEMFNQKITQFYAAIQNKEVLSAAFTSLQFNPYLKKLEAVHTEMQQLIMARLVSIAKRQQETTAEITKIVLTAIRNMIKQIEVASLLHPMSNYSSLYNELNQLLSEYSTIINRRALYNKRKADKIDNEESEDIEEAAQSEIEEPAEIILHKNTGEVSVKRLESEPLEMARTIAMVSKTNKLHLVYDSGG